MGLKDPDIMVKRDLRFCDVSAGVPSPLTKVYLGSLGSRRAGRFHLISSHQTVASVRLIDWRLLERCILADHNTSNFSFM